MIILLNCECIISAEQNHTTIDPHVCVIQTQVHVLLELRIDDCGWKHINIVGFYMLVVARENKSGTANQFQKELLDFVIVSRISLLQFAQFFWNMHKLV
jgi:hypothetical protein